MKRIFLALLVFFSLGGVSMAQDQIWTTYTPALQDANGSGGAVELGVQFRSDVAGTITAIRFYKSAANTGTHTGTLWSSSGAALGTVTFSGETASGWQQMNLTTPVAITANTTYTASYHTTVDRYSADVSFAWPVYSVPLHGLAGTYAYGNGGVVPTSIWMTTNYAVDVVFSPAVAPTLKSIAVTPANPSIAVGATQQFTAIGTYSDGSTQNLTNGLVSWGTSSPNIATVGPNGLFTGVAVGTSNIDAGLGSIMSPFDVLTVAAGPPPVCTCTPYVSLAWTPTSGAASYNVYRGTVSSGPYALLGSVAAPTVNYKDTGVSVGNNYFYVTTSVAGGVESGYSTPVPATP
jgi:hypothetical protein